MTKSANDRAAQSNLNTALTSEGSVPAERPGVRQASVGGWNTASFEASLVAAEPSLKFVAGSTTAATGNSTATGVVSVWVDSAGTNHRHHPCWRPTRRLEELLHCCINEPGTPADAPIRSGGDCAVTSSGTRPPPP